ncbi:MAG: chemotaxis protein CheW [Proteobacteria bacterium]|nr:chemotaxis protein CheW [Pseudomonadota bacterium]
MANDSDFIHCVLIPLQNHFLLLPNPTIAEVIPMPKIEPAELSPNYWLGHYHWRDKVLPVIDLESMVENKTSTVSDANKLCILNGINPEAEIEFYALPCFGAPQLIMLNEAAVQQTHDNDDSNFLHCQIKIGNNVAFIPHLDNIEASLKDQA